MQQLLQRNCGVSLRDVLPGSQILGDADIRPTSCSSDWRSCQPGDLFVALVGAEQDGHDDARDAVARGASAVLCERPLPVGIPACIVEDTREAFGRVCQALAGWPGDHLRLVGVTGTSGKTTTSLLAASILEHARRASGVLTSLLYDDSIEQSVVDRAAPSSPEVADWLARARSNGCGDAIVEVSSQSLAERRMAGLQFDAAVLTNLHNGRLDLHGSVKNYRRATSRLFDMLKPGGFAVVNADDPASVRLAEKLNCPVMTFGRRGAAQLTATVVERHASEQTFLLCAGNDAAPVRTRVIGDAHLENCLAAAATALAMGVDLMTVIRGLEAVDRIPGCMDRIECGQPFSVYVDAASSPGAFSAALKSLRQTTRGRVICVLGVDGGDVRHRPLLGRAAERLADVSIISSGSQGDETPLEVIHDILDGYDRPARAHTSPDRLRAIHSALGQARAGDSILIAGQGCREWESSSEPNAAWDDRLAATVWLRGLAEPPRPRLRIAPGTECW